MSQCPTCGGEVIVMAEIPGEEHTRRYEPVVEDHELCEGQVNELVRELEFIRDSKAFSQLSHAKQDHLKRAIKMRGIRS